jgi:hypothetical protein
MEVFWGGMEVEGERIFFGCTSGVCHYSPPPPFLDTLHFEPPDVTAHPMHADAPPIFRTAGFIFFSTSLTLRAYSA